MSERHILYRFFDDDGGLLYVGITKNPVSRFRDHQGGKPWADEIATIALEYYPDRTSVIDAEMLAIRAERPRYNIAHNTDSPLMIVDHCWDMTDAGYEISVVQCPYCHEEHPYLAGTKVANAYCGRGSYRLREDES